MDQFESIVDRIYEAAVLTDGWRDVCDTLTSVVNGFSSAVFSIDRLGGVTWIASRSIEEQIEAYLKSDLPARNTRPALALSRSPGNFYRDIDLMSAEQLIDDPIRSELLVPIGFAWEMGAAITEPSGTMVIHSLLRATTDGPFGAAELDRANALKPHLARAAMISARLAFRQNEAQAEVLSALGLAAAALDGAGNVVVANKEFSLLSHVVRIGAGNRLTFEDQRATSALRSILSAYQAKVQPQFQSFAIRASLEYQPHVVHVIPIKRSVRDIFGQARLMLLVSEVSKKAPLETSIISGLFDLTLAEARVARLLANGQSSDTIAADNGVSKGTVRSQIKAIFSKTGVHRHADFVALLGQVPRLNS